MDGETGFINNVYLKTYALLTLTSSAYYVKVIRAISDSKADGGKAWSWINYNLLIFSDLDEPS